ncbi:MAG: gluconate kinase [Chitinophagaceae bacterium]|nr:MAG: gluconate kinase [Chitinophagaceae bacterium]
MKYILGIDIGTTNTKAVAYDLQGKPVAQANSTYPFISEHERFHELDPRALFNAVIDVMKGVLDKIPPEQLAGVSFSSAMHGLIAVDDKGEPLTNMITWADLRSHEYAMRLKDTDVGHKIYERTGTPIHAMSPLCKLMWMKENLTEVFNKAHKFISIKEYVFYHFFGEFVIDHSIASSTGLFDIYELDWNKDALNAAGVTANRLSALVKTTHVVTGLSARYAEMFGISGDTPFIIGASDGCLAHIGSNALGKGDVSLTIGTSGAVRMMVDKPAYDPKERIFNYVLMDNAYLSGGPLNNGGNVMQWFAKGFLQKDFSATEEFSDCIAEACAISPGADGLIFLPYIYGERAPVWDADAKGIFYGVSSVHTSAHFMRAIMEGISFALLEILSIMEETIGTAANIYASGGFIRSEKWKQLLADVLGRTICVTHAEDSSAAGAGMLGMLALGFKKDLDEMREFFSVKETFEPDLNDRDVYLKNYKIYSELYLRFK